LLITNLFDVQVNPKTTTAAVPSAPLASNQSKKILKMNVVLKYFLYSLSVFQECGLPVFRPIERIVGGFESTPNSWYLFNLITFFSLNARFLTIRLFYRPWQVMITDGMIMCGASLIDNNWIVTAAHCTEK
jgi:hypothetical protein